METRSFHRGFEGWLALFVLAACAGYASCGKSAEGEGDADAEEGADAEADDGAETLADTDTDAGADADADAEIESEEGGPPPLVLVSGGVSPYRIVLEPEASPSEARAAQDLQQSIEEASGARLPIASLSAPDGGAPMIVLGLGPVAQALGVNPDPPSLGEQGYVVRTVPPHLVLAGTAGAGTMYAVHRFIEEYLGVRWLAPGVTLAPHRADVAVPPTDRLVRPAFLWRHTSYAWPGADDAFLAHMTDNNGDHGPDDEYGLEHSHDSRCHSYFTYVSPDEFFDTHPEYFSEIGGVRVREDTQLCLTNEDVFNIVLERMLQRMADNPGVRQFNFSQMDHYNGCQCDQCRAINEAYGTDGGTQFWFVNRLAEETSRVHPDKIIGTLAYTYTEEPPVGVTMHPNTAVWLCHMYPSCDSHPVSTCPLNADYRRRAEAWADITDHLYIWHYITNFTHYYEPFPNLDAMTADMRFYRDIGVEGVYLQGMGNGGGGGEFSLLRPYYGMKLLWDPDQDPEVIMDDFLDGYYGIAAGPIREYIRLLHDKVESDNIHMHLYTNPAQGYLPDEIVAQSEGLFDEAKTLAAGDSELLDRVQVARMPLVYARLFPRNGFTLEGGQLNWTGEIASFDEVFGFINRMQAHGFTAVREFAGDPLTLLLVQNIVGNSQQVVTLVNESLAVDVVPTLAGRALRITDLASGECITAYDTTPGLYFPFQGGLEDRIGGTTEYYGWVEPASFTQPTDTSLQISLTTMDGLDLTRTLTLEPGGRVIVVDSVVTNPGSSPRDVRLRSHLELDLGVLRDTCVSFTQLSGGIVDEDVSGVIAGLREGVHYYDQDAPDGSWIFTGTKGLEVTQRFDNAEVEFTWLYAYPESLNELELELWRRSATLGPGESVSLHQEIEVQPM